MAQAIGSIIAFIIVFGIPYLKKNIENQKEIEQKSSYLVFQLDRI